MNKEFFQRMNEQDQSHIEIDQTLKKNLSRKFGLEKADNQKAQSFFRRFRSMVRPLATLTIAGAIIAAIFILPNHNNVRQSLNNITGEKLDDWMESETETSNVRMLSSSAASPSQPSGWQSALGAVSNPFDRAVQPISGSLGTPTPPSMPSSLTENGFAKADANLGFAVGGAKDINNFRENIAKGFLPLESDVTYEGLFYDYSFDTGRTQPCNELLCPSYTRAFTRNPLTGQDEYYLSVGLNSNLNQSTFKRPKTNFVVVLDISGSMGSPFDQYYYDQFGKQIEIPNREANKTKMQLASESLNALIDQLKPDDRLGIVLFSDDARVAKPLRIVKDSDVSALKRHISSLQATNGTNMSAGLERGTELFKEQLRKGENEGYNNRLIFITDAMPNQGEFGTSGLNELAEKNAKDGIAMTFIGIGVDFQSELVEAITKVRGANYVSIHSGEEFNRTLGKDFDLLVTPLVYDLRLSVQGSSFAIDKIYGSPDSDLSGGEIMHVRTLFPSRTQNGETRGGIILLKLRKTGEQPNLTLKASYEDTQKNVHQNEAKASFQGMNSETFDGNGIRKGVLLARYAELLKDWLRDEHREQSQNSWERTSQPLRISRQYQQLFQRFTEHFRSEAREIGRGFFTGDQGLQKEIPVLEKLSSAQPTNDTFTNDDKPVHPQVPMDDWRAN